MSVLQQLGNDFDPGHLRESHVLELKLEPDQMRCYLPDKPRRPGCSHDICRELRNSELASDFNQFANADGGVLLFGVRETKAGPRIEGVQKVDDTRLLIENAVKAASSPPPLFESLDFEHDGKALLGFYVHPSTQPIWTKLPRGSLKIVRRIDATKLTLDAAQTMEFVTDMSRANHIKIVRLFGEKGDSLSNEVELAGGVVEKFEDFVGSGGGWGGGGEPPETFRVPIDRVLLVSCSAEEFELQFSWRSRPEDMLRLPYSTIKHVWRTARGRIGLVLDLKLVVLDSRICVD